MSHDHYFRAGARVALTALGCKTNQYEIDALAEALRALSFRVVEAEEDADVYVLNTCTVTAEAERKARQLLRRYRRSHPDAVLVVCGCYAQQSDLSEWADIAIGTGDRVSLPFRIVRVLQRRSHLAEPRGEAQDAGRAPRKRDANCHSQSCESAYSETDGVSGSPEGTTGEGAAGASGMDVETMRNIPASSSWTSFEELGAVAVPRESRAFLKIQDGCDYRCSYCAISIARGPARSRSPENILAEAEALADRGFREIVLTGTNINLYGRGSADRQRFCSHERRASDPALCAGQAGRGDGLAKDVSLMHAPSAYPDLADLVYALNGLDGLARIRLGSLDPFILTPSFLQRLSQADKLCPHFHLSLQSGSDRILALMKRKATRGGYMDVCGRIRRVFPSAGITTDMIVGFPGETERDFEDTCSLCESMRFLRVHVFPYSKRPGTAAAGLSGQVDPGVMAERASRLRMLASRLAAQAVQERIGKVMDVLVEQTDDEGRLCGYSPEYLYVRGSFPEGASPGNEAVMAARGVVVPMRMTGCAGEEAIAVIAGNFR